MYAIRRFAWIKCTGINVIPKQRVKIIEIFFLHLHAWGRNADRGVQECPKI